jgi:hypothetical protein
MVHWQILKGFGMKGEEIKEEERTAIGMCIQNSYILPNRNDMRSIVDITELYEIAFGDKNDCN